MSVVTARPVFSIFVFWDNHLQEWIVDTDTTEGSVLHMHALHAAWRAARAMNDAMPHGPENKEAPDAKH